MIHTLFCKWVKIKNKIIFNTIQHQINWIKNVNFFWHHISELFPLILTHLLLFQCLLMQRQSKQNSLFASVPQQSPPSWLQAALLFKSSQEPSAIHSNTPPTKDLKDDIKADFFLYCMFHKTLHCTQMCSAAVVVFDDCVDSKDSEIKHE